MADNRGAQRLRKLGLTQSEVASAVGTNQSVVSRWERGERKPDPEKRAKLEDLYAIGWRLWDVEIAEEANGDAA